MNFKQKKTVLFDLDGTLTDSGRGIVNSFKYAIKAYGMMDYDENMLKKFVGPPLNDSFMSLPGFDEAKAKEAIEIYREYYRAKGIFENELYDGIDQMLKNLWKNGKKLILATSKAEVFAMKILEHFEIAEYFYGVVGSQLDGSRIKKGEVIRFALDKCRICELESTVMVGDREFDILGAKEGGIESIGVLYGGYGTREELENAGATAIVETVEELEKAFL
jgi:Predicted phosphatases